jgi:periodic tryptophan protein 1
MSMITATTWVPRGFAAPMPTKYQFDEDEYDRISKLANLQLEDAKEDLEEAQAGAEGKSNGTSGASSKKKDDE